jgi:hypothetical protein
MPFSIDMSLSGVLLAGGWRTQDELNRMPTNDQRNALIVELGKHTTQPVEYFQGFDDHTLVGKGAIVTFLRKAGLRRDAALKHMTDDDQRSAVVAVNRDLSRKSVAELQTMNSQELVQLGLVWFARAMGDRTSCSERETSRKRWEDSRHRKLIEGAVQILKQGAPEGDVASFQAWWDQKEDGKTIFRDAVFEGLRDADYNILHNNLFTFSSHFYDPDTKTNYFGTSSPTAMESALWYFYDSLEEKKLGRSRQAGYQLGLSLHYLTDLSQPMHAANFRNYPEQLLPNMWHSMFEKYAEDLSHEVVTPQSRAYLDQELKNAGNIKNLVDALSRKSKQIFESDLKPFRF